MPSQADLVEFILDNLVPLDVRTRPMFGSHGLWCGDKFVGIISGGHLYIKRSGAASFLFAGTELAPPFPGAKDWHRVPLHMLEDPEWLRDAIQETAAALPAPTPKRRGKASRPPSDAW